MKFGAIFPHELVAHHPDALRRYVAGVEERGFEFLVAYDHVVGVDASSRPDWTGPYTSKNHLHEPFVLFGFLAAVTRLELVTGVLVLPQRQTALVAKQAADLDLLLDGRLRLGVAVGWNHIEQAALGMDFATRGARMEEQMAALRLFWTRDSVTYRGRFHDIDRVSINPLPKQRPIPLWMGGAAAHNVKTEPRTAQVLDRIGRLGDGWISGARPLETLKTSWAAINEAARRAGRDPQALGLQVTANVTGEGADPLKPLLEAWRGLGVSHVSFNFGMRGASLDEHFRMMDAALPLMNA